MAEIVFERNGAQIVTVNRVYGYLWRESEPLEVGDKVVAPGSQFTAYEPWVGTVTSLGSDYTGHMVTLISKAPTN